MKMYEFLSEIVEQLELCEYKTSDGLHDLKDSSAFHALKGMAILEKAAANDTKLASFEPNKFIVINRKHLVDIPNNLMNNFLINRFDNVLDEVEEYLPDNKYIACNRDEPYAQQVLEIILRGEASKEARNR